MKTPVIVISLLCCLMGLGTGLLMFGAASDQTRGSAPATDAPRPLAPSERIRLRAVRQPAWPSHDPGPHCGANSGGLAVFDYDQDGVQDVLYSRYEAGVTLMRGLGGLRYADATSAARIPPVRDATGLSVADYDNDGRPDVYISAQGQGRLLHNSGRFFADRTASAGLLGHRLGVSGAWGDVNNDGRLDLYLVEGSTCTTYQPYVTASGSLLIAQPEGSFRPDRSFASDSKPALGMAGAFLDLDGDANTDLYAANDRLSGHPSVAWRNDGRGGLTPGFPGATPAINAMGVGIGDADNDGRIDLAISDIGPARLLYNRAGHFESRIMPPQADQQVPVSWSVYLADLDNDGDQDLLAPTGTMDTLEAQAQSVYLNRTDGFTEAAKQIGLTARFSARGAAVADLDGNGSLDLVLAATRSHPRIFTTQLPAPRRHWAQVRLIGDPAQAVSRDACGSQLTLTVAGRSWTDQLTCASEGYMSSSPAVVHFGTGTACCQATLEVRWAGGRRSRHPLTLDRTVTVRLPRAR